MDIQAYIESGVIESYVLGIASSEERTEVENLLSKYPEVQKAIDDFSSSLEQYALASAVPPPATVKANIKKELATEFQSRPASMNVVVNNTREQEKLTPPTKYKVWRFAAVAAIILFLISSASTLYFFNLYSKTSEDYQALLQDRNQLLARNNVYQVLTRDWASVGGLLADTAVTVIRMKEVSGRENKMATVFWNKDTKQVAVMTNNLPDPATKQYQLWALVGGKPVSAGMISYDKCGVACKMNRAVPAAQGFAISLEDKEEEVPTKVVVIGTI